MALCKKNHSALSNRCGYHTISTPLSAASNSKYSSVWCNAFKCCAKNCILLLCILDEQLPSVHLPSPNTSSHCLFSSKNSPAYLNGGLQLYNLTLISILILTAPRCTALHCTALHCTALHCNLLDSHT